MDACAIIVFSPILRERNLCRSKQYILYSSSGALAYRLCSPYTTWSHLYRIFFELRGKSICLLERKERQDFGLIDYFTPMAQCICKKKTSQEKNLTQQNANAHELENLQSVSFFPLMYILTTKAECIQNEKPSVVFLT